jgi:hypothetical protein
MEVYKPPPKPPGKPWLLVDADTLRPSEDDSIEVLDQCRTFWPTILCPACGFAERTGTHVRDVFTRMPSGDKAESDGPYIGTRAKGTADKWRRNGLVVVFDCENGCVFELVIQQHKGADFVFVNQLDPGTVADKELEESSEGD